MNTKNHNYTFKSIKNKKINNIDFTNILSELYMSQK